MSEDWTARRRLAAQAVAEDKLSDWQIGELVGVSRRTLATWKTVPAFAARVAEVVASLAAEALKHSIAAQDERLKEQDARWRKMQQVIADRATDDTWKDSKVGYETGLVVRNIKSFGSGEGAGYVNVFEVDTGLLAEMRSLEAQVAKELGQTAERRDDADVNIYGGQVIIVREVPQLGV